MFHLDNAQLLTPSLKSPINYLYKLKICSKTECCKQCRHVKCKGAMTKWPEQKHTQNNTKTHRTPTRNRHSANNMWFSFFFSDFLFLFFIHGF